MFDHLGALKLSIKVGVSFERNVSLCFVSSYFKCCGYLSKQSNGIKMAPACTALTQVLHCSHNARTANCDQRGSGEKEWRSKENKGTL